MAEIFSFNEAVVAAANAFIATGGLTPTFSDVTITGGTTTTNNPVLDMTQTWNNGAVTFTGAKLNVTDTASAAGSLLMDLQVGGTTQFSISKNGSIHAVNTVASYGAGGFYSRSNLGGISIGTSDDVVLRRDAPNILALRNGTAAQSFNVYNTYTDASNYERAELTWNATANAYIMRTIAAGTGSFRNMILRSGGTLTLGSASADRWVVDSSGHFIAGTDNTYDIGASGANRPRNLYVGSGITAGGSITSASNVQAGTSGNLIFGSSTVLNAPTNGTILVRDGGNTVSFTITAGAANLAMFNGGITAGNISATNTGGSSLTVGAGGNIRWNGLTILSSPVNGNMLVTDAAGTSFGLLQFGGTTSASPAIKRSGVNFDIRKADDSGFTGITALDIVATGGMQAALFIRTTAKTVATLTAAATAGAGARSFVTDANATMAAGIGTVVVGGGSNAVPVYSDGTNWLIG